jgi:hypothetical protein
MNVDGAMTLPDAADASDEWKARFSLPITGSADYWDAVAFEQSPHLWNAGGGLIHPVDPGITVPTVNGDRRYDYFLTRPGNGNRTLQHAFIDHPLCLTVLDLSFTSDHWPVVADLMPEHRGVGTSAARGIPIICDETTPSFGTSGGLRKGEITWFCVLNAGTYEFSTFGAEVTLYGADNLSRHLAIYLELNPGAERSVKYLLPDAPVFVKLQANDRFATPRYSLNVRRYLGTSLRDAIGLVRRIKETSNHRLAAPNSDYECRLGDGETVTDARYFEFDVLQTSSGLPQLVQVECTSSISGAPMRLILGQEIRPDVLNVVGNTRYKTGTFSIVAELEAGHYFVVVQRQPASGFANSDFSLSWDSNMSVLYTPQTYINVRGNTGFNPLAGLPPPEEIKLTCIEETDSPWDLGSDDITVELLADGVRIAIIPTQKLKEFDTGESRSLDPWISSPITYVAQLQLKIVEEDSFVDDRGSLEIPIAAKYRDGGRPIEKRLKGDVVVVTERTDFSGGTYSVTMTLA